MSALVNSNTNAIIPGRDPVYKSIEILLDTIHPPEDLADILADIRRDIHGDGTGAYSLADMLARIASLLADCRLRQERQRTELSSFVSKSADLLEDMEQSISAAELQAQSSFQGAQKTGTAMERQIQDITYRLKISRNVESMKTWFEQRLSIVQSRLDDFDALGAQQQATLSGQFQNLMKSIQSINQQAIGLEDAINVNDDSFYLDGLTGLDNRLGFESAMNNLMGMGGKWSGSRVVMLMCDIDRLADINNKYGSTAGDDVLKNVARKLRSQVGSENYLARLGSDRFVALLMDTDIEAAHLISDQLCATVGSAPIETKSGKTEVTICCGYSEFRKGDSKQEIFARVDKALLQAKAAGRNCCWFSDVSERK